MILPLLGLEIAILRRDRRAWWSLLALAIVIVLSCASIALETARVDADKQKVAAAERARWLSQGEKDPHSAAHYSIFAFKPAPAMTSVDPGGNPFLGQTVWLEAHHQNDMMYRPQQNASPLQRIGFATPAALIAGVAPLVVFLLAFTLVAQERERGTTRLALGAAIHPSMLVIVKMLAVWASTAGLLVVPVTAVALGQLIVSGRLDQDALLRLMTWSAAAAGYLAVLVAIGIAVCLRASNARLAMTTLFGLWIAFSLVLPRAASTFVDTANPLPSSQSIRQQMASEAPAFWSDEQGQRNKQELLARYGVSTLADIPNPRMAELDLMERHSHEVFDRILIPFYDQVERQDRWFALFGFLSPTIAVQAGSAALAGTDFSHHRHFIDTAERYRRELVNRMNADGMGHRAHGAERHTNDERLWSQIPEFIYLAPPLGTTSMPAWPAFGALLLWLGIAAVLLAITARKLHP